jgi:hypothetical protein
MQPIVPSWFKQRQAKAEPAGDGVFRLTGPNMAEAFITIRKGENGLWQAALLQSPSGPELDATAFTSETPVDAWNAAFELHRVHLVV